MSHPRTKDEWRLQLLTARRAVPVEQRAKEAELLAASVCTAAQAAFEPLGHAPGALCDELTGSPTEEPTRRSQDSPTGELRERTTGSPGSEAATTRGEQTGDLRRQSTAPEGGAPASAVPGGPSAPACGSPGPAEVAGPPRRGTVCCYVPLGTEPGSLAMLDALSSAGYEVLLPIVPEEDAGQRPAMDWADYQGPESLQVARYGLRQPAGRPRGPEAIRDAGLVLVPALAVDRRGVRLGRGAGWYDRSLPLVRPGTPLVAVIRDTELLDVLPSERHDVLMTGMLTPHRGLRKLPLS